MRVDLPTIPEAISDLASFQFYARKAVEGTLSGIHRSGLFGSSIEFAEHKLYSMGDDLRHIDWKVYGRADKFYLKKFEEETNLRGYLVLDTSSSMNFGSLGFTKLDYAKVISASLAYLLISQQDLVGLVRFGPKEPYYIPPRGRLPHFNYLSEEIQKTKAQGVSKLNEALNYLLERVHRRAVISVFSDFLAPMDQMEILAKMFKAGRHDVFWFHLLDPAEVNFPYQDWIQFKGLEGEADVTLHAHEAVKSYQKEMQAWLTHLESIALENHILYRFVKVDEPPHQVLTSFLS